MGVLKVGGQPAGVIYAILLQRKELELQRRELEDTREVLELQKEELKRNADQSEKLAILAEKQTWINETMMEIEKAGIRPNLGVVTTRGTVFNQNNETVFTLECSLLVVKRQ